MKKKKPPQAPPKEGMSLIPSHISSCFKLYPIRTSPPLEGLGEAFLGGAFTLPVVQGSLHSPFLSVRGRG